MSTPMFAQYDTIKATHRDAILLFRLGDFYEMFGPDAREGSRLLGLTLTQRQGRPMCGVPHHAAKGYIGRLLKHGKKVAICEQVSLPDGKGITRREVVEVLSPGTIFDPDFLDPKRNNYILAIGVVADGKRQLLTICTCDASVGELIIGTWPLSSGYSGESREALIQRELARRDPGEILVQESLLEESTILASFGQDNRERVVNRIPDWGFDISESSRQLRNHLGVQNLHGFGLEDDDPALFPVSVMLDYLQENARHALSHLQTIRKQNDDIAVILDEATVRNLEIVRNIRDGGDAFTLVGILDQCCTPMGSRRLRQWLLRPLRDLTAINTRHDRVAELYHNQEQLQQVRELLNDAYDLERLVGRLGIEKAHPKDLLAIAQTLTVVLSLLELGLAESAEGWLSLADARKQIDALRNLIQDRILPDPPITLNEGGIFVDHFDPELDQYRRLHSDSRTILDSYLGEQREETGISSLKIKYNRVLGHFFEVPRSQAGNVPDSFIRRQSLANAERYTTARLSDLESEINNAQGSAIERERALFLELRGAVTTRMGLLSVVADQLAELDCIAAFARAATLHGYRRPVVTEQPELVIRGGRHPVVEAHLPAGEFVSNDISLNGSGVRFALITGPNMAGKSTVLRQTALIALMAHAGSFVPADEAQIGLCDRIFCRVGASDNIARGESTFLVEMNETSNILRNAGPHSLVIMDEVGRGTSTHDGLSIAWAVCEALLRNNCCRTLFATHYHELARLDDEHFATLGMAVEHSRDRIIFLKKLTPGSADHSYGVDVARLAGLPEPVILRARELLAHFEGQGISTPEKSPQQPIQRSEDPQEDLFSSEELLLGEIRSIDPDGITPRKAHDLLYQWHQRLRK